MDRFALRERYPGRHDIPVLTITALVLLAIGQSLPIVTVDTLGPSRSTFSILSGIVDLVRSGNLLLGLILLVFSIVFPILKLVSLLAIWFKKLEPGQRDASLTLLKVLGKWSMLDVFVVVILVGSVKLGILAQAEVESGIYVFASAILLSLVVTFLIAKSADRETARSEKSKSLRARPTRWHDTIASATALVFFAAGLFLPIMHIEEWVFWNKQYSIATGTWKLLVEGELFLASLVLVFVVLVPATSFISLVVVSLMENLGLSPGRGMAALRQLNKWSMIDVFGLAVTVVVAKIGGLANVEPRMGLWMLAAAVALSLYLSWRLRDSAR